MVGTGFKRHISGSTTSLITGCQQSMDFSMRATSLLMPALTHDDPVIN
jgi:hypothetical protein